MLRAGLTGGIATGKSTVAAMLRELGCYLLEADNQEYFAQYYEGHPVIHVPRVIRELSTERVLTTELVSGERFEKVLQWNQHERDMAAETINRFVSRSLYRLHAFNGDPHPGNRGDSLSRRGAPARHGSAARERRAVAGSIRTQPGDVFHGQPNRDSAVGERLWRRSTRLYGRRAN